MEDHFAKILFLDLRTFLDGIKVLTIMNLYAALALIDQQTGRVCENLELLFSNELLRNFTKISGVLKR